MPERRTFQTDTGETAGIPADFDRNAEHALQAYRQFNESGSSDNDANYCPELIELATRLGYLSWPRKIRHQVQGRRVLDIGCGRTLHSIGFLVVGATRYVGCDPKIRMDSDALRDRSPGTANSKERKSYGWTPRRIMERLPRVTYLDTICTEETLPEKFDLVLLHNVTEHAPDLHALFRTAAFYLDAGGTLIFNHHNFFSWNGHHLRPRDVKSLDLNDPAHQKVSDWGHLDLMKAGDPLVVNERVNRVTLKELRDYAEEQFCVVDWKEQTSSESQGADRFTPDILTRHPGMTERDLRVQNVFCLARLRD